MARRRTGWEGVAFNGDNVTDGYQSTIITQSLLHDTYGPEPTIVRIRGVLQFVMVRADVEQEGEDTASAAVWAGIRCSHHELGNVLSLGTLGADLDNDEWMWLDFVRNRATASVTMRGGATAIESYTQVDPVQVMRVDSRAMRKAPDPCALFLEAAVSTPGALGTVQLYGFLRMLIKST